MFALFEYVPNDFVEDVVLGRIFKIIVIYSLCFVKLRV